MIPNAYVEQTAGRRSWRFGALGVLFREFMNHTG